MKMNENNNLLGEIIRQHLPQQTNKVTNNCLYLATESLTVTELGAAIRQPPLTATTLREKLTLGGSDSAEVGGITQKITVSPVEFSGQKIIFLDTPGHSDFVKMRQRGIALTDLVVLVIDGQDGIMSQTAEIIDYLHEYKLPVIVFINHKKPAETDNETNLNRLKTQLQEKGFAPLEWGGETIVISGNAQAAASIKNLLENILLFGN
ncbi:5012_t:CDS:2 [Ambispora gerdemannii]|uniref:5012_t:CDS:1 n=1 Tax=Ambispora gerdemannii TaxID=144530 RepID=A0A9N9DUK3_9GLOM|nr:5012_t:CDS:2 [Ambispora gerdemannii]